MTLSSDVKLTLIDSFDEACDFVTWLGERRPVLAIDTETEGFHWWRDRIRLVQIGDARHGWAMRWDRWSGLVEEALRRYDGPIAMHNFKFDSEFLKHTGVDVPMHLVDDTRTMAHLIMPARPTGLKPLSASYLGSGAVSGQDQLHTFMKKHKWDWKTVPVDLPEYWIYGALDTVLTATIWELMQPEHSVNREIYDIEMAAQNALMEMEMRGARIDLEYASTKGAELRQWANEARAWAQQEYGGNFNIGSSRQLAQMLMSQGWEPTVFTDSGQPSTAKEVLENIDLPLAKLAIDVKHAEKMASAYFDNFIELTDGEFLHAKFNPIGARTGRMACTEPNLQNQPRDALVRDAFIPREGNKLVLVDYDQMEVRLTAHFVNDPDYIQAIMTEEDIHRYTAAQIYTVSQGEVTKPMRQVTKNAVYAIIYGSGIATFAKTAGVSTAEAKRVMDGFNSAYPRVPAFKRELEQYVLSNRIDGMPAIRTPYGRLQVADEDKTYKLMNYLVQGTGADVLKLKIAELASTDIGQYMIMPIHDEIIFDVPEEDAKEVMAEAMKIMTCHDFKVPLTVDGTIVDRWGDKYRA